MKKVLNLSLILIFLIFGACSLFGEKEDDNPNDKLFEGKVIRAKIKLPEGLTSFDPESLKVISNIDSSPVSGGEFGLNADGEFTAYFASYSNGEVAMMGYSYPGTKNLDISPRSTALAMVMMTPAVLSLSDEGKKVLITQVQNDPTFNLLELEITKNLELGGSLFDEDNMGISNAIVDLFANITARISNEGKELPVNTFRSGRNFTFNNKGSSVSTVVGIYQDTTRVGKVVVEGVNFVPTSFLELLAGLGEAATDPIDKNFMLQGDGDFTLKYRTGRPGSSSGVEHDEAFYENLFQFSLNLFQTISGISPPKNCLNSIREQTIATIQSISDLNANTEQGVLLILYTVSTHILDKIEILYKCIGKEIEIPWYRKYKNYLEFLTKHFDVISNGANSSIFGIQWASTEPFVDVCYEAKGSQVEKKEKCLDSITDPRDGNIYKVIDIGNQTWFAENLRYAGNIPQVTSQQEWAFIFNNWNPTGQSAWVYYLNDPNNNDLYGKLYNWYAVNSGMLCPQGWHIPTDAEWEELIDFLGGQDEAPRKMKVLGEGTNESGFSARLGGIRNIDGFFKHIGSNGFWWSSTSNGEYHAFARVLFSYANFVPSSSEFKAEGYSCRCVKD